MMAVDYRGREISVGAHVRHLDEDISGTVTEVFEDIITREDTYGREMSHPVMIVQVSFPEDNQANFTGYYSKSDTEEHLEPCFEFEGLEVVEVEFV